MKLTYWISESLDDRDVYSIRERTKRAALAELATRGGSHGPVRKVTIEYADAFDLVRKLTTDRGSFEDSGS